MSQSPKPVVHTGGSELEPIIPVRLVGDTTDRNGHFGNDGQIPSSTANVPSPVLRLGRGRDESNVIPVPTKPKKLTERRMTLIKTFLRNNIKSPGKYGKVGTRRWKLELITSLDERNKLHKSNLDDVKAWFTETDDFQPLLDRIKTQQEEAGDPLYGPGLPSSSIGVGRISLRSALIPVPADSGTTSRMSGGDVRRAGAATKNSVDVGPSTMGSMPPPPLIPIVPVAVNKNVLSRQNVEAHDRVYNTRPRVRAYRPRARLASTIRNVKEGRSSRIPPSTVTRNNNREQNRSLNMNQNIEDEGQNQLPMQQQYIPPNRQYEGGNGMLQNVGPYRPINFQQQANRGQNPQQSFNNALVGQNIPLVPFNMQHYSLPNADRMMTAYTRAVMGMVQEMRSFGYDNMGIPAENNPNWEISYHALSILNLTKRT